MLKKLLFLFVLFLAAGSTFADNNITLEVNGVIVQGGLVYVAVYSNENDYRAKNPFISFVLESVNSTLNRSLELPNGEYVVTIFQDLNSNEVLDTNFLGMRKEPVGITNYNGRGIWGFHDLKETVSNYTRWITVKMVNVRL
jgi:uncharacterized protein (DUF2141 family)